MASGDRRTPRDVVQYRLLQKLESHARYQVWEAVDARTGRRVALQQITPPAALPSAAWPGWAAQVEREAWEIAGLKHPHIAPVHDAGVEDGRPFAALALPNGPTLRQRLRPGALPLPAAMRVLDGVAAALDAAHAQGIAHRNLSPAVVVVGDDGTVVLRGFWTDATGPSGDANRDIALDRQALGLLLRDMLATPPGAAKPPAPVQAVLGRALAPDLGRHYASAGALAEAFRAAVQEVEAAPKTPRRPLPRPPLRLWATLAGLGLLGLLLFALYAQQPAPPLPPPLPLPVSTVLPVPQTPDTTPPDPETPPFKPLPPRPVHLPDTDASPAARTPRPKPTRRTPGASPLPPPLPDPSPFDPGAD